MRVLSGKSLPWILASAAMLAIVGVVLAGAMWPDGSSQATTAIPRDALTESLPAINPVDASLAPAGPEFATVVQEEGGEPAVSEQQSRTPANISISPEEDWNPVKTQHDFIVTVTDAGNAPVAGAEVELILNRFSGAVDADGNTIFSVGDIVSIDNGEKVDNTFGKVTTNAAGQVKFTITSTREGDTDVTAYAPGIADADKHKVFAVKHWIDKNVVCPPAMATNQAGTSHEMTITVFRASSGMDVDGNPAAPLEGETVAWRITENDPAATLTQMETSTDSLGRATATLEQVTPVPGDNTVTISVVDADNRPMFNCDVVKNWIAGQLGVTKTASAETVNIGETVTFTIEVQNLNQAGSLTGVDVSDSLPSGFETNNQLDWTGLTLAAGATETFTITATAIATGTFTNEVTAVSIEDPGPATSDATVTVVAPDVSVSKSVTPDTILVGQTATYTITVVNNSPTAAATNVFITDNLDPSTGLTEVSSNLPMTIAQLPAGGSETYTVTVMGVEADRYTNVVSLDWDELQFTDGRQPSASATLSVLEPNISLNKTTSDGSLLYTGETGTYTIIAENTGQADLTNVSITDTIPSNMSYRSSSHGGTESTDANGNTIVRWSPFTLAVGDIQERTITLHADRVCDSCPNMANVTTAEGPEATAEQDIQILPATGGNIRIAENTGALMRVGETVEFTATVENENDITPMTEVNVSIAVSDHFSIVATPDGATLSGSTVSFEQIASLAPGESRQFTITVEAISTGQAKGTANLEYHEFPGQTLSHDAGINILPARQ